ncbi:unnamed protein product [Meloidogyne enterolobii]|uniref:Uncharacterized protein n=1 Tax=Meloidogyne enterolobii TaxID=390850 RepID=A0ACB0Z7B8_MELEN
MKFKKLCRRPLVVMEPPQSATNAQVGNIMPKPQTQTSPFLSPLNPTLPSLFIDCVCTILCVFFICKSVEDTQLLLIKRCGCIRKDATTPFVASERMQPHLLIQTNCYFKKGHLILDF